MSNSCRSPVGTPQQVSGGVSYRKELSSRVPDGARTQPDGVRIHGPVRSATAALKS